ncbi:MAG: DUF882 domain-containing protein [Dongiaceae bacterium]
MDRGKPADSRPDRRRFLQIGLAAALLTPGSALAGSLGKVRRSLSLVNLHTGEKLAADYWVNGAYVPEALREINRILRDFRTGDVLAMDVGLLDLLSDLRHKLRTREPFEVISGYRSPKTNAMLAAASGGVARKSLHMQGMAIDLRVPGRSLRQVRDAALAMRAGGVGFYPKPDFVHVDVGRVRAW